MKKLSATYSDLNSRLQLIRNQLMVDAIPTQESVTKYSHHLLAELDTMGHQAKKKEFVAEAPKLKKFYLSDTGCRRGKGCTFSHDQKDEKRRCWNFGSADHMSPACARPKEGKDTKPKIAKAEKENKGKKK